MKTYPLFKVHIPLEEALTNVRAVLESGYLNEGEQVTQLTVRLSKVLGAKNLVLVNSCTSALTLALRLCDIGPGDEVISTPMTCVATNTPILNSGAKLVWADIDPHHGMLTPDTIKDKITDKTKAVVVVAWAGTPPDLHGISKLCHRWGIKLILDAAHAFGATFKCAPDTRPDFTCYSFQAIKHITTGDGGALVCRDEGDFNRAKALKWFGLNRDETKDAQGNWKGQQWDANIVEAGYKFNMNNVSAAIGLAQLSHIGKIIKAHVSNADHYDELFSGDELVRFAARPVNATSSFWVYTMLLSIEKTSVSRDELLKRLNAEGIMAGVVHIPNDGYEAFKESKTDLPALRWFSHRQFSLPCGWWLEPADIEHIAQRVKELAK